MAIGLVIMGIAVFLLFAARTPTDRYLDAFAIAYKRLPKGREWLVRRDQDPEIERLRRNAVALRVGAFLVFLVGGILSVVRLR
jgi:hypothetical protein